MRSVTQWWINGWRRWLAGLIAGWALALKSSSVRTSPGSTSSDSSVSRGRRPRHFLHPPPPPPLLPPRAPLLASSPCFLCVLPLLAAARCVACVCVWRERDERERRERGADGTTHVWLVRSTVCERLCGFSPRVSIRCPIPSRFSGLYRLHVKP